MAQNIFAQGMDAFDRSYDRTQAILDQRTRRQAGRRLAAGDTSGAAGEFANAGMIDQARVLQRDQMMLDDRAADERAQQAQAAQAAAAKRMEILTKVAGALKGVPIGQRKVALSQATPLFEMAGVDPSMFDSLTEDQLSDGSLDAFTGEMQAQYKQFFQNEGGIYGVRPTGQVDELKGFERKPTIVPDGSDLVGPDGKPLYRNTKNFAPPKASGGRSVREMSDAELLAIAQGGGR